MSHRRGYMPNGTMPMHSTMTAPRSYYLPDDAELSEGEMEAGFPWSQEGHPVPPPGVHPSEMHENMIGRNTPPDVTEIYRRKPENHYGLPPEVLLSDDHPRFYYRPAALARLPQRRLPMAVGPTLPPGATALGAYYPPPLEEPRTSYAEMLYRSQPHLQRVVEPRALSSTSRIIRQPQPRMMPDPNRTMTNLVRSIRAPTSKPPVSVPTPRFYRRASIYKRPSTLCLQLPSTPDPSTRPMKSRLPSTMPGFTLPLHMRNNCAPHYASQQQMSNQMPPPRRGHSAAFQQQQREMEDRDRERERDREHSRRGKISARSAPPIMEERAKEMEEFERVRMMMENRNMQQEFGDDLMSNTNEQEPEPKCSELELLLNQYEQIFNNGSDNIPQENKTSVSSRRSSAKSKLRRKTSVGRIVGMMKPKMPPSLKKHGGSKSSLKPPLSPSSDRLEIEQMTAEVLDTLLQDLSAGGLVTDTKPSTIHHSPKSNRSVAEKEREREPERTPERPCSRDTERINDVGEKPESRRSSRIRMEGERERMSRSGSKSKIDVRRSSSSKTHFNQNMESKKSETFFNDEEKKTDFDDFPTNTTFMQDKDKFNYNRSSTTSFVKGKNTERSTREQTPENVKGNPSSCSNSKDKDKDKDKDNMKRSPWTSNNRRKDQDGSTALELHRSKSYIVNLIDRALSRELGTIPEERPSKQYLNLDAKAAIDLMSSKNLDNDMCMEISQALADSFNKENTDCAACSGCHAGCSNQPKTAPDRGDSSKEGELIFTAGNEEPLYIKQLKKLRWGHLKHIQREMRRLEDLERFLDSCGSDK